LATRSFIPEGAGHLLAFAGGLKRSQLAGDALALGGQRPYRDAHRARLAVRAWRFANENTHPPADFRVGPSPTAWGDHAAECRPFYRLGIDDVLTDFPDAAVAARRRP
jgi:glycerophosphoryl diester phosphodiesterase